MQFIMQLFDFSKSGCYKFDLILIIGILLSINRLGK